MGVATRDFADGISSRGRSFPDVPDDYAHIDTSLPKERGPIKAWKVVAFVGSALAVAGIGYWGLGTSHLVDRVPAEPACCFIWPN